jgi:hypothetical protein
VNEQLLPGTIPPTNELICEKFKLRLIPQLENGMDFEVFTASPHPETCNAQLPVTGTG